MGYEIIKNRRKEILIMYSPRLEQEMVELPIYIYIYIYIYMWVHIYPHMYKYYIYMCVYFKHIYDFISCHIFLISKQIYFHLHFLVGMKLFILF